MHTLAPLPIPGPRGLPLLGGRAQLLPFFRDPFGMLRRLHAAYGPVAALARGDPRFVFGFGPALNHHILAQPELFTNGSGPLLRLPAGTDVERLFTHNLAVMNGAHHKQQRRLMQPAFHRQQVAGYGDTMVALTQQTLDRWRPHTTIDLLAEMQQLTQRIAVTTLFGLDDPTDLARVGQLLRRAITAITSPLAMFAPIDLPGFPFHRANRLAAQLAAYIRAVVEAKRCQPGADDVLAALVAVRDADGEQLSDAELIGHAFTLFVAGHETTTNALTWTLFLLDQHPQVCADLLDEIDSVLAGGGPTVERLERMPLLAGVVNESLRLLPPAAIGVRTAAAPCEVGGYALPVGATVFYSPFITHRLPELYDTPDQFVPARWLARTWSTYEYLPFAAGPHMCIGWAFALQELKLVLASLLPRYRLAVAPQANIAPNIGMRPLRGMPVRVFAQDRQFRATPVRGRIRQLVDLAPQRGWSDRGTPVCE